MPGLYIHIPFCKQACHYCDFHFSTGLKNKDELLLALRAEIGLRRDYLGDKALDTIYFGGGTPSLLEGIEIRELLAEVRENFNVVSNPEITLEANPDDLTQARLRDLKECGINRLSIGIQSFSEIDLKFMNRAHDSAQAMDCVRLAHAAGFDNISIDLIYGTPTLSDEQWNKNLDIAFDLGVQHLSCYALTVEPRTALAKMIRDKKVAGLSDEKSVRHFEILMKRAKENDFEHYEISNFARPGKYSRHNTSYWKAEPYLGIGPSAHSYNRQSRQWNISNNHEYIRKIMVGHIPSEREDLSEENKFNEYILTNLRTIWGVDAEKIRSAFGEEAMKTFLALAELQIMEGMLEKKKTVYFLSHKGKFYADRIASDFFMEPEE